MKQIFSLLIVTLLFSNCSGQQRKYIVLDGFTMGTSYHIIHDNVADSAFITNGIATQLKNVDQSLSIYNPQSIISKINRNENVKVDSLFTATFLRSYEIYLITGGAFDISASPLFNVWGFGFKNREKVTQHMIDSLKLFCGMEHVKLEHSQIIKNDPRVTLNANAIAKGYGVDVVAHFLEQSGVRNYIVEIGGEIRCKGINSKGRLWAVGIDKPIDGNNFPGKNLQTILQFSDRSLATSGNYRKFYEENGKKYAHTINPATGYPVLHNLLSVTVIASDCMTADAYATAFMVMGVEETKQFLIDHPELGVYLIFEQNGKLGTFSTPDVQAMIR